ncbi:putative multidrug resistance protein EmrK [Starkeya nomas]|uniref:Putative multidrug resistance protein EmrK n=1 Tax=Starkeya nomas TaxID=2666134 RepID=A0A5S9NU97_9HYPH|nr:HlyD family secretion protein [Starkeya nomas]CAA0094191.1 putative multidrug resistance protein EmrK [Starkeya nomas]
MARAEAKRQEGAETERPRGNEPVPITVRRSGAEAPADPVDAPAPAKPRRRGFLFGAILAVAVAGGGYYGLDWWRVGRFLVSTDDAYVGADTSVLAAKVSGHIVSVDVETNQPVRAGDVIARIDDGDYALALRAADGKIATQQATIDRYGQQIEAARASVDQAKAQRVSDEAELDRAQREFDRQSELVKSQFSSKATLDNARADRDKAQAAVDAAKAAVASAEANVSVLEAQRTEAARLLEEYRTARDQSQRDLDFTVVKAPFDGIVGNRAVQVGQLVQPGTRLVALVPITRVYVDANFKETQLGKLRPGQAVNVEVDAYPDEEFHGRVTSVAPASGSVFSLLPPENATGNFTKIVQRVPVRIELDEEARDRAELRPGMSVIATVDTRTGG